MDIVSSAGPLNNVVYIYSTYKKNDLYSTAILTTARVWLFYPGIQDLYIQKVFNCNYFKTQGKSGCHLKCFQFGFTAFT